MKTLETSGGLIAYDERGGGHPIVTLAAGGHTHRDYDELRNLLPARYRSIALDWPGHGASPPGRQPATAMLFADIAEEAIASLAPEGAVVVGSSVGGYAAARLALRRPELVKGLVLLGGGGFQGRGLKRRTLYGLMARPFVLRTVYPLFATRYMRVQTDADWLALQTAIASTRTDPGLRALSELWRSFASPAYDLRDQARNIGAATLVLWGRRDPVFSQTIGRQIKDTIPNARFRVLDTGHLPHTSNPVAVAAAVVPFADAVTESRPARPRQAARHRLAMPYQTRSPDGAQPAR